MYQLMFPTAVPDPSCQRQERVSWVIGCTVPRTVHPDIEPRSMIPSMYQVMHHKPLGNDPQVTRQGRDKPGSPVPVPLVKNSESQSAGCLFGSSAQRDDRFRCWDDGLTIVGWNAPNPIIRVGWCFGGWFTGQGWGRMASARLLQACTCSGWSAGLLGCKRNDLLRSQHRRSFDSR